MSHMKALATKNVFVPRSRSYASPFGRLFPKLKPWRPGNSSINIEEYMQEFAVDAMSEADGEQLDNTNLPAGYTYFGQFVDHDITFDPTSSLQRQNDPNKLHNFRTPRLDLDCVYGSGPADQPYIYDDKRKGMLLVGNVHVTNAQGAQIVGFEPDLPRNDQGRALIGDMRNDENLIVSQFQLAMHILHNRIYAKLHGFDDLNAVPENLEFDQEKFSDAQRILRWFYQFVVWNDFVKRIIDEELHENLLSQEGIYSYKGRFYQWNDYPFIPVEFSVAAYRFGHTLIRPGYQVNTITDGGLGFGVELPIFNPDGSGENDLHGFRFMPEFHTVQWDWFFRFPSSQGEFPQSSRMIDAKLAQSVFAVPEGPNPPNFLAFLNLLRSFRMELPGGSDVARMMGLEPHSIVDEREDILWHYILKESQLLPEIQRGQKLGPVGGTIVGEVFAGLLKGDGMSYVNCSPNWTPAVEEMLPFGSPMNETNGWQVVDILRAAGMPATPENVDEFVDEGVPGLPF